MKKFFTVFFYCIGLAFLNLVMQIIAAIPFTVLLMFLRGGPQFLQGNVNAFRQLDIEGIAHDILLPSFLLSAVLTFGVAWLIHVLFKKPFFNRLSFTKTSLVFIITGLIIGCSLQLPVNYIMYIVEDAGVAPELFDQYAKSIEPLTRDQNFFLQILAIGIIGPVLEEIVYRGLIFHQFKKYLPISLAIIIQSLLFGFAHMNVIQGSYAFILGILMALTLVWSHTLLLPISMHIGMNLFGIVLSEYGEGISDPIGFVMLAASIILAVAGMVFLYWKTKNKTHELKI